MAIRTRYVAAAVPPQIPPKLAAILTLFFVSQYTPPEQRVAIAQVAQLLALLSDRALPISDAIVERAYELWTAHLASRRTTGVVGQAAFYDCTPAAAAQQRDTLLAASREAETLIAGSKGDELVQALYRSGVLRA